MTGIRAQKRYGRYRETYYSWQAYCRDKVIAVSGEMHRTEAECFADAIKSAKLILQWARDQGLEVDDEAH